MSDYFERVYKPRNEHNITSDKNQVVAKGIRQFERYLYRAATKETIVYNEQELLVSIQTTSQDEVGQRSEKIILAPLDTGLGVGSIFEWGDDNWLILTVEKLSIPTHIKGKIRYCNHVLKWYNGPTLLECPAHVITNRGVGIDEGTTGGLITVEPSLVIVAIVPYTDDTSSIKRDQRFIIDSVPARVTSIDDVSVQQLRIITMKEDIVDMGRDIPDDSIADVYVADTETGQVEVDDVVYAIEGSKSIVWNQSSNYTAKIDDDIAANVVFTGLHDDLAMVVSEETENPAEIVANNNGIVGNFSLQCYFVDQDITVIKIINIVSLWG